MNLQNNILRFNNLSQFPSLIHGFSTRFFGSMLPSQDPDNEAVKKFTKALNIDLCDLVRMDQVHGNTVCFTEEKDMGKTVEKTDGLITDQQNVFLGVITADCLPIFLYDRLEKLYAVVHAGWRGLYSEIIKEAVSQMIVKGSKPEDIIVGIGPSIRVCCYEVSEKFVENFREQFGDVEQFIQRRNGKIFFNLQKVAKKQLYSVGLLEDNIEDADYCTFDHDDVYSFRREGNDVGRILGIIGIRQ